MSNSVFNLPPWEGVSRPVGFVWRLTKCGREGSCRIWTHPHGGELRVEAGGTLIRSAVCLDMETLVRTALMWKTEFRRTGWLASLNP
jgi:hypothetical protein